jgi:hypothetical protein
MNLRHYVRVTVKGERTALTVKRCQHCPEGTMVYMPVGFRSRAVTLGHISRVARRDRTCRLMISTECPGDVPVSSRHGVVMTSGYRMIAFMRALRFFASEALDV